MATVSSRGIRSLVIGLVLLTVAGCGQHNTPPATPGPTLGGIATQLPPQIAAENQAFLNQKKFDPWILETTDPGRTVDPYLPWKDTGTIYGPDGGQKDQFFSNIWKDGMIVDQTKPSAPTTKSFYAQILNMQIGNLSTHNGTSFMHWDATVGIKSWQQFWNTSDIVITGDPEAQQVTHANMFYLAGSAAQNHSIAPMGLSSKVYDGHIFWDAEIWMMPALIVQHPDLAYGIIDYRYKRLAQAQANAKAHGFAGAEYPWESAQTGKEEAPDEFSQERHITADIAYAAWQYYQWTGDNDYLTQTGWPIIKASADYWISRAKKGADGKYHILQVIGPDETSGTVDDDAWTNGVVAESLRDADYAAKDAKQPANPQWATVAANLAILKNPQTGLPIEHAGADDKLNAKQADTQMLIYPLGTPMPAQQAGSLLDYCLAHTIQVGPAMTDSINALIAARLGRSQQSLDLFHDSYRPFMRGPFDAFSEKRTRDNLYFCTGMGGCLQTVLYGFAGLNIAEPGQTGQGKLIAKSGDAALYADPHLPPGWTGMTVMGIQFRKHVYDLVVGAGNTVTIRKRA